MGPRLAPLALLLLALCGYAAGLSWSLKTVNSQSTTSSIVTSKVSSEKKAEVTKKSNEDLGNLQKIEKVAQNIGELLKLTGNSLLALAFSAAGALDDMHPNIVKAFAHGVLCEVDDKLNENIKRITTDTNSVEVTDLKINCAKEPTDETQKGFHKCMCQVKNVFLYCLLEVVKTAIEPAIKKMGLVKGTCREDAVKALERAGTTVLGSFYAGNEAFLNSKFEDEFNGKVTEKADEQTAKYFCDAIDENVEKAVKAVYASDALYWITETVLYTILFGEVKIDEACKNSEYKSSTLGECVCAVETGFTFCMLKALGTFYDKAGYLKCKEPTKSFDTNAKPTGVPQTVLPKAKSSAATAFSLLVPTFAAATLLLRH